MSVVIGQLSMIFANHTFRIGMARIPIVIASMMFGPIAGAMAGFLQDIIGVIVLGSWFHPGFALSAILVGVIPGAVVWLTRKKECLVSRFYLEESHYDNGAYFLPGEYHLGYLLGINISR